jgi:hypothetical protein
MKTRSLLLALVFGFLTASAFAAGQSSPVMSEDLAAQIRADAQNGDNKALAQAVVDNPTLAAQIASVAAAANPSAAASIAATIAAVVPKEQAASIAAAVTTVAPRQAAVIAAAVALTVQDQASQIAGAVAQAAPSQAGAVAAAVKAAVPASSAETISAVATATNSSTDSVTAQADANKSLGIAAAQTGSTIAAAVSLLTSNMSSNGGPQVGVTQHQDIKNSPNVPDALIDGSNAGGGV